MRAGVDESGCWLLGLLERLFHAWVMDLRRPSFGQRFGGCLVVLQMGWWESCKCFHDLQREPSFVGGLDEFVAHANFNSIVEQ